MSRTFTENEQRNRDAWITNRVENDCEGCESSHGGEMWTPAQDCPVHGEHYVAWWAELNTELDKRWPGVWAS